jgi:protein phosphatase
MTLSAPEIIVNAYGLSDLGLVRTNNEDNFLFTQLRTGLINAIPEIPANSQDGWIFIVADGMGGGQAGEVASQMAVELVAENFTNRLNDAGSSDRQGLARALTAAVEETNQSIFQESQSNEDLRGMGTTLTAAVVSDETVTVAQLGDSRAYLVRDSSITQITKDQSLVAQMVATGKLSPEEAKTHPRRNVILQALGIQPQIDVVISKTDLKRGDQLVLCSDGLWGKVESEEIKEFAERFSPQSACESLVRLANDRGGEDNITVIVVTFSGDGLRPSTGEELPTLKSIKTKRWWWFWRNRRVRPQS